MADAGDALPLKRAGGTEQRPGGREYDPLPPPLPQTAQQKAVQHRRRAAAAAAPGVHILCLPVIEQQPAVRVVCQLHALPAEQLHHDVVAHRPQVAGEDQVIVPGCGVRLPEQRLQRVAGGGGRSQGCTMWKMFSVKFNAYSSPEARRF